MAQEAMKLLDATSVLIETVSGYRASCEAAGFSPQAAEMMAVQFHAACLMNPGPPKTT